MRAFDYIRTTLWFYCAHSLHVVYNQITDLIHCLVQKRWACNQLFITENINKPPPHPKYLSSSIATYVLIYGSLFLIKDFRMVHTLKRSHFTGISEIAKFLSYQLLPESRLFFHVHIRNRLHMHRLFANPRRNYVVSYEL